MNTATDQSLQRRWDPCIAHRGSEVDAFITGYFAQPHRSALLVAGAGFDPRARAVADKLSGANANVSALLIKELRPSAPPDQSARAHANTTGLVNLLSRHALLPIDIFGPDGAVVGGRNVVKALSTRPMDCVTDVIVDVSALSVGTSFPIIRYFFERAVSDRGPPNLHLFVTHDPSLDGGIRSISGDSPGYIHGFRGNSTLSGAADSARLWLPQLSSGRRQALERLYEFVEPHDTCPILPFPARQPRLGDILAEEYITEFEDAWSVDTRNIMYADEGDPLDLYRTILRLGDFRQQVFAESGGSMLVLSPLGSKVMALGALMAALERDLPVAHIEPIAYRIADSLPATIDHPDIIHVWLEGDAYPSPRPPLTRGVTVPA